MLVECRGIAAAVTQWVLRRRRSAVARSRTSVHLFVQGYWRCFQCPHGTVQGARGPSVSLSAADGALGAGGASRRLVSGGGLRRHRTHAPVKDSGAHGEIWPVSVALYDVRARQSCNREGVCSIPLITQKGSKAYCLAMCWLNTDIRPAQRTSSRHSPCAAMKVCVCGIITTSSLFARLPLTSPPLWDVR